MEFLRKQLQCNLISVWFQPTLTQSFENKSGKLQPIPCNVKKLYTTEVRLSNDNVSISSDILITSCWLFQLDGALWSIRSFYITDCTNWMSLFNTKLWVQSAKYQQNGEFRTTTVKPVFLCGKLDLTLSTFQQRTFAKFRHEMWIDVPSKIFEMDFRKFYV